jgi:hypothetical protein
MPSRSVNCGCDNRPRFTERHEILRHIDRREFFLDLVGLSFLTLLW